MKKYIVSALFLLIVYPSIAQQYYGVDNTDESLWSVGLLAGVSTLQGDVQAVLPGYQGGLFVQKKISNVFDLRVNIQGGLTTGQDLDRSGGFMNNSALNGEYNPEFQYDTTSQVFFNYQMEYYELAILMKINLNRLFSPSGSESWDLYALAGVGALGYQTKINGYDEAAGMLYPYESITKSDPETIRSILNDIQDDTYETPAQRDIQNSTRVGNLILNTSFHLGGGFSFSVSPRLGLGLEGRYTFVGSDLLDGQQWTINNQPSPDNDRLISAGIFAEIKF